MRMTFDPPYFAVRVTHRPDTLIAVSGELDLAAVPVFKAAFQKLELARIRGVVLDLAPLTFIDVAGLHAVLDVHAMCLDGSKALTIMPGAWNIQRVFELTGCDRLLPFSGR